MEDGEMTNAGQAVAEISLYGTGRYGAGFIVRMADGRMIGDGEPLNGRSMTEALWLAMDEVMLAGGAQAGRSGRVYVHIDVDGAPLRATISLRGPRPYFGALSWEAGTMYEISADAIARAAQEG
jgi:hypothetical protein